MGEFARVDMTIEKLATTMVSEFARVDEQFVTVNEQFASVNKQFASVNKQFVAINEQLVSINGELKSIRIELRDINRRLDALEEAVKDVRGYAKEIDELRTRVKVMEAFLESHGMKIPS